ncbi:YdbT family protein [Chitinophaga rhizophila]|uniref:PH domain-containing protein n=1 Tax=Chitinophaga rhizophila TaxID=2866212 RepID=A0ABS7GI81_9BACT|nr:hypothetical protein [Chitinophaga rhizophila]MBW8687413.1 hypothetical protein [Chitinophaga rhizophila]
MPEPATHESAIAANRSSTPLLETDVYFGDILIGISFAALSIIAALFCFFHMSSGSWGGQLTLAVFFLAVAVWILFTPHTFHLYTDRLIIRKPLTRLSATTTVIPLDQIKEVTIRRAGYGRKSTFLLIETHSRYYEYRIARNASFPDTLIHQLRQLGIQANRA